MFVHETMKISRLLGRGYDAIAYLTYVPLRMRCGCVGVVTDKGVGSTLGYLISRLFLAMDGEGSGVVIISDQHLEMNLELAASNPQLCSEFLSRGFDLCDLQRVLQDADHTWMERFLRNGGLPNLLSTLDRPDSLQECVVCVKLVLNHKLGVKILFEQPEEDQSIRKLVQGIQ